MRVINSLTKDQKEAVGLLQIGTFLEYFDLMLYVHMAVLLNDLFFPPTDPYTKSLIAAFAFCSTYLLRPFGALIFGYLGDNIGRKSTIILSTGMMSLTCIIMACTPTYENIGITAAWVVTFCRIIQGMSSMGETIGSQIYLTEITKPPFRYFAGDLTSVCSALGGFAALAIASFITTAGLNWRIAFGIGSVVAVIGAIARTRLKESPDFVDMRKKLLDAMKLAHELQPNYKININKAKNYAGFEKPSKILQLAYFIISSAWPASFYFTYIHCANILTSEFGFSSQQIINQNLLVSIIHVVSFIIFICMSLKINPIKIILWRAYMYIIFMCSVPYMLMNLPEPNFIFYIQVVSIILALSGVPGNALFISHFPVFKRFTYTSFMYALSRAAMYVITSFSLVFLVERFSHYGLLLLMIPLSIAFVMSVKFYEKKEKKSFSFSEDLNSLQYVG